MSFNDVQADLKKQFLSALIKADFECSGEVYDGEIGERTKDILSIHRVAQHILYLVDEKDQKETQDLMSEIEEWLQKHTQINTVMILKSRKTLSKILSRNFYGQLNMRLIPAGTAAGTIETPKQQPADPYKSARI